MVSCEIPARHIRSNLLSKLTFQYLFMYLEVHILRLFNTTFRRSAQYSALSADVVSRIIDCNDTQSKLEHSNARITRGSYFLRLSLLQFTKNKQS